MQKTEDRPTTALELPRSLEADTAPRVAPAPRGWGSHAERRLMRQVLAFFAVLGLYAVGFVLIGAMLWT